jgi:hypothetical protein
MASVTAVHNIAAQPGQAAFTFATLPTTLEIMAPMWCMTSDAGMCFYDGAQWNIAGLGRTRIVTASGAVTALYTDRFLGINKTTGAATAVALYTTVGAGHRITISDVKGDAATNNITITPTSGTIDGSATYLISTAYGSWSGYWTGAIWKTG